MNILLVFTEINQKFGPLGYQRGLALLSAVLKKNGISNVSVAHYTDLKQLAGWEADVARTKPDLIGFHCTTPQLRFIKRLVEHTPKGVFTIAGGPHLTCFPPSIESVPRLDAICIGEGEYPMLELATALQEGRDPSGIRNLWVRSGGAIIRNPTRPLIENLDELPYEDRHLFDMQRAIDTYGLSQIRVRSSRGCPYQCTYCANKRISEAQPGRYVRFRSAAHLMGELNELKREFRFEEIFFDDDIFMTKKDIRREFCERYPREIGKPFLFNGRVENCDEEMLRELRQAGARRLDMGLESGNEDLRRRLLKRNMSNEDILRVARLAQSVGLQVKTFNMTGLPGETEALHMDTVRLNQAIRPDVATLYMFEPYPGTELYQVCLEKGYLSMGNEVSDDYVSWRDSSLTLPDFPRSAIQRCYRLFGYRVFLPTSRLKAWANWVLYSRYGETTLSLTRPVLKVLRRALKGF
jgi:radical SAM superfamily enzyme YgiQ (UPF0313 family)